MPSSPATENRFVPARYQAFGLLIECDMVLPELAEAPASSAPPDVSISRSRETYGSGGATSDEPEIERLDGRVTLTFRGIARFTIDAAQREIQYALSRPGEAALVRLPLLGPVIATFIHMADKLVLHASAVSRRGRAVILLGDKGAGKSTTAAAFLRNGYELVTDDLLTCEVGADGAVRCHPSYPQLKLLDDAAAELTLPDAVSLPSPHPDFGKVQKRVRATLPDGAIPIRIALVLGRRSTAALEPLDPQEALAATLQFAYILRYGTTFLSGLEGARHFSRCANFVHQVPVARWYLPTSLASLDRSVKSLDGMIEASSAAPA
jgi:hypothetical protein